MENTPTRCGSDLPRVRSYKKSKNDAIRSGEYWGVGGGGIIGVKGWIQRNKDLSCFLWVWV